MHLQQDAVAPSDEIAPHRFNQLSHNKAPSCPRTQSDRSKRPFHTVRHSSPSARPATMPGLVTATGVLALLADEEPELKVFALKTLNEDIDTVWTEVASSLTLM